MARITTRETGPDLDLLELWDKEATDAVMRKAVLEGYRWQTARGRGADGKKFAPYALSTVKKRKLRPAQAKKVTLRKTGWLLDHGLEVLSVKDFGRVRLAYKEREYVIYAAAGKRNIVGWNRKAIKLMGEVVAEEIDRLAPESGRDARQSRDAGSGGSGAGAARRGAARRGAGSGRARGV